MPVRLRKIKVIWLFSGKIDGSITTLEFTNRRGEPGKGLRMRLKGNDDATKGVVIWGKDESFLPKVIPQKCKS